MVLFHPEGYADGMYWAENGRVLGRPQPVIVVYFLWANVNGKCEAFGETEQSWFEKWREAMGAGVGECIDAPELNTMEAADYDGENKVMRNFFITLFHPQIATPGK
jgi:hypothetical protein